MNPLDEKDIKPTGRLRFVERTIWLGETENANKTVRILQQEWLWTWDEKGDYPVWHDVPLEETP